MASTIAPTAITASTASEIVPALASTAGIVNTPAPMTVPMTSMVADVRPRAPVFGWSLVGVSSGSRCCPPGGRALTALDMGSSSRGRPPGSSRSAPQVLWHPRLRHGWPFHTGERPWSHPWRLGPWGWTRVSARVFTGVVARLRARPWMVQAIRSTLPGHRWRQATRNHPDRVIPVHPAAHDTALDMRCGGDERLTEVTNMHEIRGASGASATLLLRREGYLRATPTSNPVGS